MKIASLFFLLIIGCTQPVNKEREETLVNGMTKTEWKENYVDSIKKDFLNNELFDTIGVSQGPIKVISARMVEEEYSNYKSVGLTYKNISNKRIDAIKFKWYGEDAFGEPADLGSYAVEGFGSGFVDKPISSGKTRTSQWSILSSRGKKILHAWAYEVVFSDGSKWKSDTK